MNNPQSFSEPDSIEPLTLIYSANRYAELDTCDCTLKKLGGVHRERNLSNKWRKSSMGETLFLSSGSTFVPTPKLFDKSRLEHYLSSLPLIVNALNLLGVTAVSLSAEDLSLGIAPLRSALGSAAFKVVSSNMVDETNRPLFEPYIKIKHDGLNIFILGVSKLPHPTYPAQDAVKVLSPNRAIKVVLDALPNKKNRLIILLSNLDEKERLELIKEFPELNLVLGASLDTVPTYRVNQWTAANLFHNPVGLGRSLSVIEFDLKKPVYTFYNPWLSANADDLRRVWKNRLESSDDAASPESKKYLEDYLRLSSIPKELRPDTIPFRSTSTELSEDYELPENELTDLVEQYRKHQAKENRSTKSK